MRSRKGFYGWLAWLLCITLRIKKYNSSFFEDYRKDNKPSVIAFWHGSMLIGWFLHRPQNGGPVAALVSQSEDGEILSATLARWGYAMIRGSSHIGGKEAMQLMVDAITAREFVVHHSRWSNGAAPSNENGSGSCRTTDSCSTLSRRHRR